MLKIYKIKARKKDNNIQYEHKSEKSRKNRKVFCSRQKNQYVNK